MSAQSETKPELLIDPDLINEISGMSSEAMSNHPEIDPIGITAQALIKQCPYYIEKFKLDPEGTTREANQTARNIAETYSLKQKGLSDQEIKDRRNAERLQRRRERNAQKQTAENQEKSETTRPQRVVDEQSGTKKPSANRENLVVATQAQVGALEVQKRRQLELSEADQAGAVINAPQKIESTPPARHEAEQAEARRQVEEIIRLTQEVTDKIVQQAEIATSMGTDTVAPTKSIVENPAETKVTVKNSVAESASHAETEITEAPKAQVELAPESSAEKNNEITQTFVTLTEIVAEQSEESAENPITSEIDEQGTLVTEFVDQPAEDNAFVAYLESQPEPEEEITLEYIFEQPDEQPLKETFANLAQYLANAKSETSDDLEPTSEVDQRYIEQLQVVQALLEEIAEILPNSDEFSQLDVAEIEEKITPELTEKLLILLEHLGCKDPKEALLDHVEQNGFEFLTQTITHLNLLSHYEITTALAKNINNSVADDDNNDFIYMLGNIVLKLLNAKAPVTS